MTDAIAPTAPAATAPATAPVPRGDVDAAAHPRPEAGRPRHPWLKAIGWFLLVVFVALVAARLAMPSAVRWYVNRVLQQNPLYQGKIDDIRISLWRGAYEIDGIRFNKLTGSVPVPLFRADRLDLSVQWGALLHGRVVGRVSMDKPELNFVDAPPEKGQKGGDDPGDQTGADGPWLQMLTSLFPFRINRVDLDDGSVHFRTYQDRTPVDVYLESLNASVDDLTNVQNSATPMVTTVSATALAMGQANFEMNVTLDPFSYRPTFRLTSRLLGLDVTKVNALTRTYGSFDFEHGWFDLVIDLDAREGQLRGYVKPLFRDLKIFSVQDLKEDNIFQAFWEALVGGAEFVLKNQQRDQFGTVIPLNGDLSDPQASILSTIGNVLRNAFVRAYLPRLQSPGSIEDPTLQFGKPNALDPATDPDFAAAPSSK